MLPEYFFHRKLQMMVGCFLAANFLEKFFLQHGFSRDILKSLISLGGFSNYSKRLYLRAYLPLTELKANVFPTAVSLMNCNFSENNCLSSNREVLCVFKEESVQNSFAQMEIALSFAVKLFAANVQLV